MNRKGMTVIELIVSFSLATVISLFLIQVVLFLKDTYAVNAIKSEMILKQSIISERLNNLLDEKIVASINNCGTNCVELTFEDESKATINFDSNSRKVIIDDYVASLPSGTKINDVEFLFQNNVDTENYNLLTIKANLTNDLINNEIYNIAVVKNMNSIVLTVDVTDISSNTVSIILTASDGYNKKLSSDNEYKYCITTNNQYADCETWSPYVSGVSFEFSGIDTKYYLWVYPIKNNNDDVNDNQIFGTPYIITSFDLNTLES